MIIKITKLYCRLKIRENRAVPNNHRVGYISREILYRGFLSPNLETEMYVTGAHHAYMFVLEMDNSEYLLVIASND